MGDSAQLARVIPDAALEIHRLKRSAYTAVLRAFCAQSDVLSGAKEECLAKMRKELKILEAEHREYLVKARSDKQIKSLSAGLSKENNTEVIKDAPDLERVLPDAGDTAFQIQCMERSAYASVLRALCAVTNHLSWLQVKLLNKLRSELKISHIEHRDVIANVSSNEHIKYLRKYCFENFAVLTKMDAAFHAQHAVVHDKIASTGQMSSASSTTTSCLSMVQHSPVSECPMSSARNIGILESSNITKEGPWFEPHAVVSAKRLKSANGHALANLKCSLSAEQLPAAISVAMVKDCTDDTLDRETLSCEVDVGCALSLPSQEKVNQSNVGPDRQESGKRKTEMLAMRGSKRLSDKMYGIKYERRKNKKDSDLDHGSEIFKICLTASLLNMVEKIFRENPDSVNLETAKSMLKAQEKALLEALAKLSEVSYDVACFGADGQLANLNKHNQGKKDDKEAAPMPASSNHETPPPKMTMLGDGGAGSKVTVQSVAVALSAPVPRKKRSQIKFIRSRLDHPPDPSQPPRRHVVDLNQSSPTNPVGLPKGPRSKRMRRPMQKLESLKV